MPEKQTNLVESAQNLATVTGKEQFRQTFLRLIGLVPEIGGPLVNLFETILPDWKATRVEKLIEKLAEAVDRLDGEIEKSRIETPEYGILVEEVFKKVIQTTGDAKFEAYRAILLNALRPSSPDELERERMLGLIDQFQEIHIILLSLFGNERSFLKSQGIDDKTLGNQLSYVDKPEACAKAIMSYLSPLGIEEELVLGALHDLITKRILSGFKSPGDSGVQAQRSLSHHLEGFGQRFVSFITLSEENTETN